jgi:hypothetical protein
MSWGLHSIARLRFQASSPEWAFRRDAAESALTGLLPRHHDYHLAPHPGRRPLAQQRRQELPVVRVRWRHSEPQVLGLLVELDLHRPPELVLVLRSGRNQ